MLDSNATVSARLSSGFQASTGLTVTYGIMPDCVANTVMSANGMAGDTLEVILTSLQPDFCYSIYFNQGVLSFKVMGVLRSGWLCITTNINYLYMYITAECDVAELSTERAIEPSEMCSSDGFAGGIKIPNGRVCYTGTTPGAQHTAQSVCNQGYQLISTSSLSRECQSDGTWSGNVALCEAIPCECRAGRILYKL